MVNSSKDAATITMETIRWFDDAWNNIDTRLAIVHGKRTLRLLRTKVQELYSVNLTDFQIIDEFEEGEVPEDLISVIEKIIAFQGQ